MNRFQKLSISVLLLCLAASPRVRSQAVSGNAAASTSSQAQAASGQVVPSGGMALSATGLQGGQLSRRANAHKAKAGYSGGSPTADAMPAGESRLCFQPGIGWLSVPAAAFGNAGSLSAPGTIDNATLGGIATKNSGAGGSSQSLYARLSGAKQAVSNECPGMLTNTLAPGVAIEDVIAGKHPQAGTSARSMNMNAGAQDWLQTNSVLNPASGAAAQRLIMGLSSVPASGTDFSAGSRSGVSTDQISALKTHGYVSSIKLRRMIRNAPDLETRIKLQELQDKRAKKSHSSTANSKGNRATKERLENRSASKTHSLPPSGEHDHATNRTRKLSPLAYP